MSDADPGLVAYWVLLGGLHEGKVLQMSPGQNWVTLADPIEAATRAMPAPPATAAKAVHNPQTTYRREIVLVDGLHYCVGVDSRLTCGPAEFARAAELIRRVRLAPVGTRPGD